MGGTARRVAPALSRRARAAKTISRLAARAKSAVDAALLGALRPEDLEGLTEEFYGQDASPWVDNPYVFDGERAIISMLDRLVAGRELLDLCAGAGREARIFAQSGYAVTALERDEALRRHLEADAKRYGYGPVVGADVVGLSLGRRFDVVYLSPLMYGMFPAKARVDLLTRIRAHVKKEGVAVLPVQMSEAATGTGRATFTLARLAARMTNGNTGVELGDRLEWPLVFHHFTPSQLADEALAGGFAIVHEADVGSPPLRVVFLRPL
jgi:hypothetical protein